MHTSSSDEVEAKLVLDSSNDGDTATISCRREYWQSVPFKVPQRVHYLEISPLRRTLIVREMFVFGALEHRGDAGVAVEASAGVKH
jgi:hypothetical protein